MIIEFQGDKLEVFDLNGIHVVNMELLAKNLDIDVRTSNLPVMRRADPMVRSIKFSPLFGLTKFLYEHQKVTPSKKIEQYICEGVPFLHEASLNGYLFDQDRKSILRHQVLCAVRDILVCPDMTLEQHTDARRAVYSLMAKGIQAEEIDLIDVCVKKGDLWVPMDVGESTTVLASLLHLVSYFERKGISKSAEGINKMLTDKDAICTITPEVVFQKLGIVGNKLQ